MVGGVPRSSLAAKRAPLSRPASSRGVATGVSPVEFAGMVESMYADGARLFVEAGPRGNLSAFVEDVLRGREKLVLRQSLPPQLELYGAAAEPPPSSGWAPAVRSRTSWRARLMKLVRRPEGFRSAIGH